MRLKNCGQPSITRSGRLVLKDIESQRAKPDIIQGFPYRKGKVPGPVEYDSRPNIDRIG